MEHEKVNYLQIDTYCINNNTALKKIKRNGFNLFKC